MARRRNKDAIGISLVPILSIQKCAMGVMVVIICAQTAVSIATTTEQTLEIAAAEPVPRRQPFVIVKTTDLHLEIGGTSDGRDAVFVECQADGILIHPKQTKVSLEALKQPAQSAFHDLLDELQANRAKKRLVLLVRPEGIAAYKQCVQMARYDRNLDIGKEILPSGGTLFLTKDGRKLPELEKEVP